MSQTDIQPLLDIMAKLRDPDTGCPWDKAQDFRSIVPFTLEEAYEVADTIERTALDELPDELGDLLFQVVFYCQMAQEQGLFGFADVIERICSKLTARHPHLFSDIKQTTAAEVSHSWQQIKKAERLSKQLSSQLDNIPLNLPALSRSIKIQQRVAQVGFDWKTLPPVVAKVHEEIDEVLDELAHDEVAQDRVTDEMGDLLFAVVNMARHLDVDPEQALRQANQKFEQRFRGVEALAEQAGGTVDHYSLEQLEQFWQQVKERD